MSDRRRVQRPPHNHRGITIQGNCPDLIRQTQHKDFKGKQVVADLLAQRQDWRAALLDTSNLVSGSRLGGLIKLRDLADGIYNVDTFYILALDEPAARRLAAFAEPRPADSADVYNQQGTYELLGGCSEDVRLVTMWWD